ncbi:TIR domain-containing protein [Myxococcus xanthus]|uniref:TIR domain-containing protein n=1 Tax=Myxococcus xanthus TaxID=34 RepID=UPI00112CED49|nr:TIR domain-containing protein [Myxococcus xanthus]QDE84707.1 hypothetical protein BHS07_25895 [Myxococcus xanthus]
MRRSIFLSYVFEDYAYRDQVNDWARRDLLGSVDIVTETDDVRQGGISAIRAHLRPIMRSTDALLVLVGQDTHNRRWVDEEIHYCASSGKPIIVTRLPNSTGAAPPEMRGRQMVLFAPQYIRAAIADAFSARH